jgi:hypothetical protein
MCRWFLNAKRLRLEYERGCRTGYNYGYRSGFTQGARSEIISWAMTEEARKKAGIPHEDATWHFYPEEAPEFAVFVECCVRLRGEATRRLRVLKHHRGTATLRVPCWVSEDGMTFPEDCVVAWRRWFGWPKRG